MLREQPSRRVSIVGADLRELGDDEWRARVRTALQLDGVLGAGAKQALDSTRYVASDATDATVLRSLLDSVDAERLVIYFARPPHVTELVCGTLAEVGAPEGTVLAIEKPFGDGLESAQRLNALVTRIVPEDRVFRIDHFLGLHTVLNL
ncbi:glucose-6-phosphate dehydrogenase, partial [Escherichia coli]